MKKTNSFFRLLPVMIFTLLLMPGLGWGQISITSNGTAFTQNFDAMLGTSAKAALTTNQWRAASNSVTATWTVANLTATTQLGGTATAVSSGGCYNYGDGIAASATDRALGFLSSGTAPWPGTSTTPLNIYAQFVNSTGGTITQLSGSFDIEKYRNGTNAQGFSISFFYSLDGVNWTAVSTGNHSFTADVNNNAVSPAGSYPKTYTITGLSITNSSNFYLRWAYFVSSGTTATNAQGLGIDNFSVTATTSLMSPTLTAASSPTVDAAFDVTFTEDASWRGAITEISVGGTTLAASAYDKTSAGKITFTPSASALLQSAGTKAIVVKATGYSDATVSQAIGAGVAAALTMKTQPAAPSTNGAVLATQPEVNVLDQYGNITTTTVVASKGDAGTWTLGGTTSVAAVSGVSTYTNLTATSAAAVTGAYLTFSSGALTVNSATFDIAAPPAQIDWTNLQWPATETIKLGQAYDVYARVYEPGITDAVGQGAGVQVWIGYSTSATNPNTWTNWVAATYYGDDGANNDEYKANLGAAMTATGTYYYATRVQLGSALYVYGGYNNGFWDGTTNVSGVLTVIPAETLDWVNLQAPASGNITTAQTLDVYAQVYEASVTPGAGQGAGIQAWIGHSTTNDNPATGTGWTWVLATHNAAVTGDNDEYKATLSGLSAGTYYYASRFKYGLADYQYGGLNGFWDATTSQSGVLTVSTPEPAEHVTNFAAATTAPTHSSILLTWTDASGASNYLIKGSAVSYEAITAPADGTSETDGALVKNVVASAGTYTFTGLTGETAYFFKIFPYNGTGAAVNFKTDGTVPEATAATTKTPTLWLTENFDYVVATDLTANNWNVTGSAATPTVKVTSSSITYPGYLSSGIGNETLLSSAGGQDVNRVFTEQVSGTVYASCLVNVTSANTAGDYFFHFGPTTMGTSYRGRVFVKRDDSNNIAFGIQHTGGSNNMNINYTTFSYTLNTTYLVALKYNIVSGTANDVVALYINPVLNASEPITDWLINTDTPTDPANIGSIGLRQASASTAPNVKLDGIRVSTKWSDIVGDLPTFTGTGEWTDAARWNTGAVPVATQGVFIDGAATINSNVEVAGMTINAEKSLTVNAGKQLTVTGAATNNGTINLLSNSTDGTATLVGNVGGNAKAYQYLTPMRNWYMSSPMTAAVIPTDYADPSAIEYYDETVTSTNLAERWKNATGNFTVGKGYVVYPGIDGGGFNFEFSGTLSSGNQSIALTRTTAKTTEVGFNLVGNPYPSFLDAAQLVSANSANIEQTVWYRTANWSTDKYVYEFQTYNAPSGLTVPVATNGQYIPPMQSVWVQATQAANLQFTDVMRLHKPDGLTIPFRAPAAVANQILRLLVSNGTATDEAVIYFNANAADGYDAYDSPKMMNNGTTVPNLFTTVSAEKLVINGMNAVPYDVELPLTLQGAAGTYTITANEFSNFAEGDKVQLIDKVANTVTDLTASDYTFTTAVALNSSNRFAVLFPKNAPTGVDNNGTAAVYVYTRENRIVVTTDAAAQGSMIYVFNGVGQRLAAQAATGTVTEIGRTFPAGVYVVKVNNTTAKVVVK